MNPVQRNLGQVWSQLRGQIGQRRSHLEDLTIRGLRGIQDLRIALPYPVTVVAGPNGSGKSTVLFALAAAYDRSDPNAPLYTPAVVFPDFRPPETPYDTGVADDRLESELVFSYLANGERAQMRWTRQVDRWRRSFFGRKGARQPQRAVYLRTLANLSSPSEVRSILQLSRKSFQVKALDASGVVLAESILSYRYKDLRLISSGLKDLLFASRQTEDGIARYSEFHMSSGERAALRLSLALRNLRDGLVLIDEVETSLHPYVQQVLLLELQRLALRNQLQIVVTTHSPVVLDSVPPEGRVFLERRGDTAVRVEAYRDIIQKALYGRSLNTLWILAEDESGEAFVRGMLDYLGPRLGLVQSDVQIGRDTGKDQFLQHLEALGKFQSLHDVVFALDGDGRSVGPRLVARAQELGQVGRVIYLPGEDSPEVWIWAAFERRPERFAPELGLAPEALRAEMARTDDLFAQAVDKPANIAKAKLESLGAHVERTAPELIRLAARLEAEGQQGDIVAVIDELFNTIGAWRSGR